ncbi:MAG: hypothetical protein LBL07_14645 [Tannerella sp.]|jgi:hypothetical protein|nr:hypothetical protein [Tannerella sp.]
MKNLLMMTGIAFLFLTGCASLSPTVKRTSRSVASTRTVWNAGNRSDSLKNTYRVLLKTPNNSLTGICILKRNGDEWRGAFISEMGAKAFDFTVTAGTCTLLNVFPAMDKWYVKKTIATDLHFLFNADNPEAAFRRKPERFEQDDSLVVNYGKKQLLAGPDGAIRLVNSRHDLLYELRKMDPDEIDR